MQDKEKQHEPFEIYLYDVSYYSGKMEMLLRYKQIPFKRIELPMRRIYPVLYRNTGVMKVPAIKSADGLWLRDSTPMIDWFDEAYPESRVIPENPALCYISKLVEDYADEWLWRPAMYYRWKFDHKALGRRLGTEIVTRSDMPLPEFLRSWYMARRQTVTFLKNDGVDKQTQGHIEKTYLDNLDALESILQDSPYLLGNRPTLADFGYMGPMFRHFSLDPTPARIMRERAPAVYEWVARMWNAKARNFDRQAPLEDFTHVGWRAILRDVGTVYLPFLKANYLAWNAGNKVFDFETGEIRYKRLPVVHYRVWCMEELQRLLGKLPQEARDKVEDILSEVGGLEPLTSIGPVVSGLADHYSLPLKKLERKPGLLNTLKLSLSGTPWDLPEFDRKGE